MPPDSIKVARPTKWGNPFRVFGQNEYVYSDASHRRTILTPWIIFAPDADISERATVERTVELYRLWVLGYFVGNHNVKPCTFTVADIRRELKGKSLACFCKIGEPCHAEILLELANGTGPLFQEAAP